MMQSLSNKHCNQTGANSFGAAPPPGGGHLSLWFPSSGDEAKMGCHHTHSSSGQPNLESATFGFFETSKKERENHVRPFNGNADYASHQVQMEHPNQPLDIVSYPFAGSYFGRMYDPNTVVYPQMMGMAPTRAVLPLDCSESLFPIYVNAKQYHAILRRRQTRAKLEARNKMIKSRKPYLHESRHLHALKRVRGSGGRFLNTKNMQEEEEGKSKNPSKNNSWGDPTTSTSGSDVSCIFNNNDDIIFTQPGDRLALSIDDGYSQFSTTPA